MDQDVSFSMSANVTADKSVMSTCRNYLQISNSVLPDNLLELKSNGSSLTLTILFHSITAVSGISFAASLAFASASASVVRRTQSCEGLRSPNTLSLSSSTVQTSAGHVLGIRFIANIANSSNDGNAT